MAGKIIIEAERCKGCTLCVTVCPHNVISISERANSKGYFPAEATNPGCTGCANCAVVCPDCAIEVYRDKADGKPDIVDIGPARLGEAPSRSRTKKNKINNLVRELK